MTANTMRDAFEEHADYWARSLTLVDGEYCDDEVNSAWLYFKAGAAWQAAQSVPVMGEAVARLLVWRGPRHHDIPHGGLAARTYQEFPKGAGEGDGYWHECGRELFEKPTTSITHAELDAKDARIRELEAAALDVCMAGSYESARLAVIQLNTVLRRPAKEHQS